MNEVLKYLQPNAAVPIDMETTAMLVNALRQSIADLESQEPLGYITIGREVLERALKALWVTANPESEKAILDIQQALAAQPPQRTWVGLTPEEFHEACWESYVDPVTGECSTGDREYAVRWTEAKLKEKNT
jgi:hypothetical protein